MMLIILLVLAVVLAGVIAAFRPRFGLLKPAIALFMMGLLGAVLFMVGVSQLTPEDVREENLPWLGVIGGGMSLVSVLGLLTLTVLRGFRHWSGFYRENSP